MTTKTATPIAEAVAVAYYAAGPAVGERFLVVDCADYDVYKNLPNAVEFQAEEWLDPQVYVKTGWNSDIGQAFFKTGKLFARAVTGT